MAAGKLKFQVECEFKPGFGFAKFARNLGTFSTQAKADQVAALYRSEGYSVRITSLAAKSPSVTTAKVLTKGASK
jgi:hypothetical protein